MIGGVHNGQKETRVFRRFQTRCSALGLLARHRNVQYSPEVQQKLAKNRQKLQAKLIELRTPPKCCGLIEIDTFLRVVNS